MFKIIPEEYELALSAMNLSNHRRALLSDNGITINNELNFRHGWIDKRPILFQFLVATANDIFGYNPNNIFRLNLLITFLLLFSIALIGFLLNGPYGALLALMLSISIPLMAQNTTGAGLELLNLLMLFVTILSAWRYLELPNKATLTALIFSGILLVQVRYESMIFLIALAAIVLLGCWRSRSISLSFAVAFAPFLLLVPMVHLSFIVQIPGRISGIEPDPVSLAKNLFAAFEYFFFPNTSSSMNGYVGATIIMALLVFSYLKLRLILLGSAISKLHLVILIFNLCAIAGLILVMNQPWGNLKDPLISRFSLPLVTLGILSTVALIRFSECNKKIIFGLLFLAFYFITLPATSGHHYTSTLKDAHYLHWTENYFAQRPAQERYLIIAKKPGIFLLNERQSIIQNLAILRATQVKAMLDRQMIDAIYAVQELYLDPETGGFKVAPGHELGRQYRLEPLAQHHFSIMEIVRISKVVEITPDLGDRPQNYPGFAEEARTGILPPAPITTEQVMGQIKHLP